MEHLLQKEILLRGVRKRQLKKFKNLKSKTLLVLNLDNFINAHVVVGRFDNQM
jgi:hypothetical protein